MSSSVIAVTGGTGFVGKAVIAQALSQGLAIRALTRRPQPETPGVTWVQGALDDQASLAQLVSDCSAVLHIAGVTNVPTRDDFIAGNIVGTEAVISAAQAAGVKRFVHVSSLSVREPQLSTYGWSKAEAETLVAASGLEWVMVRPPGIFGPGDVDYLDMFKAARFGVVPLPPRGRSSVIAVDDLARLLLLLCRDDQTAGQIYEVDDGRAGGWTHGDFARAIAAAMGRRIIPLHLPAFAVQIGARMDRLLRGDKAKLTPDRAGYFCHPDWVIDPARRPPADLWQPQLATPDALAATLKAYREAGWL